MPEGHTVHRVARQLGLDLVGRRLSVSSPQGRFAAGAARLDGRVLTGSMAVGKQLFLEFESSLVLRVHLGLYGAWDLSGNVSRLDASALPAASMGAPRVSRVVRLGEVEREVPGAVGARDVDDAGGAIGFPPAPVGQVRVRLATADVVADLRGPSACEVLDPASARVAVARLGPDAANEEDLEAAGDAVVRAITSRAVPIGRLLMDQSVLAGIGNVYRAELLFRARLDPWVPGRRVPADDVRALWRDWAALLDDGIRTGVMLTRTDLDDAGRARALVDRDERHWVYGRAGLPCRVCRSPVVVEDMAARSLYRCPVCQGVGSGAASSSARAPAVQAPSLSITKQSSLPSGSASTT